MVFYVDTREIHCAINNKIWQLHFNGSSICIKIGCTALFSRSFLLLKNDENTMRVNDSNVMLMRSAFECPQTNKVFNCHVSLLYTTLNDFKQEAHYHQWLLTEKTRVLTCSPLHNGKWRSGGVKKKMH